MSNKKKKYNTYIIHTRKTERGTHSVCTGRYAVGAKNEKEAINIIREKLGAFNKYSIYYKSDEPYINYKEIAKETYIDSQRVLTYI